MPKGISLEQFREQLETDAVRRNAAQEKTIKEQAEQIKSLRAIVLDKNHAVLMLSRRCKALTHGLICDCCDIKGHCFESREG